MPDLVAFRLLANWVTEIGCPDAIAMSLKWEDWEQSFYNRERYLHIQKRIEEKPHLWDFLEILANGMHDL